MAHHYRKDRAPPRHISASILSETDTFEDSFDEFGGFESSDEFRETPKPSSRKTYPYSPKTIASFGLILFHRTSGGKTKFLIYQRRDTYDFIDLMRGLWSNEYRLREMCCSLTPDEKQRIRDYSFRELWDDLWIVHGSHIHLEGYERAFRKFEMAKTTIMASINLEVSVSPPSPPWGFPKGKKNPHEKEFDCALREFVEETNLDISGIEIVEGKSYLESYKGSNGKFYSSHYFLAESPVELEINRVRTPSGCIRQWTISPESADLRWVTTEEAFDILDLRKADILRKAEEFISELPPLSYSSFSSVFVTSRVTDIETPRVLSLVKNEGTFRYTKLSEIPEFRPKNNRKR